MITDEQKRGNPNERAAISERREISIFELRGSRDDGSKVANSGHEIADCERPVADAIKPVMHPADLFVADVQHAPGARMQELPANGASDDIAARDSADAAAESAREGGRGAQVAAIDQKSATGEQEFVGNGNADDAEDKQSKDREVAIRRDPMEDGVFQLTMIAESLPRFGACYFP